MTARHLAPVPDGARRSRARHLWIMLGGEQMLEATWGRPGERRRSAFVTRAAPTLWPFIERDVAGGVRTWSVHFAGLWIGWERRAR